MDDDPLDKHRGRISHPRKPLWYLLSIFFGILLVIAAITLAFEPTYSSTVISEIISKNPFQVYKINTICELADLLLENNFSFQSYHEDFEKQYPTEWNNRQSYYKESEENILKNYESKTLEQVIEQEKEQKIKLNVLYSEIVIKYFSINPDLKGEFALLFPNDPYNLLWLKEKHPECTPLLEEKYG